MLENKISIATISLGQHPSHTLERKILAAASHHFSGLEIVYSDLEAYSSLHSLSLSSGATAIRKLCAASGMSIISLCPFKNFEGHNSPLKDRLAVAAHWISTARRLGAKYLQVPSQFDPASTIDHVIDELRRLADLGAEPGEQLVEIAYEAVAWGTHVSTWEQSLEVVQAVDRPNFGLCLDSFHIITRLWADNTAPGGKIPGGDRALKESLDRLVEHCPLSNIFYIQLSDAELFDPPLGPAHELYNGTDDPKIIWSRNARPFPLETGYGGYFPTVDFAKACLVEKGFKGWVSFEVFDRRMRDETVGPDVAAERGADSWRKIKRVMET
jgi:sugar phosphate isomerase/epimerase